ncbi:MAG TPA: hypothetical protein VFM28_05090 [Nitrososphaeraceae archaeon]|nr:hypothetical protein [Nitrososphaeraceae archaeon]
MSGSSLFDIEHSQIKSLLTYSIKSLGYFKKRYGTACSNLIVILNKSVKRNSFSSFRMLLKSVYGKNSFLG